MGNLKITYEGNIADESHYSIVDAITYASLHPELWKVKKDTEGRKQEIMSRTDLSDKCGSCKSAQPVGTSCYVTCDKGYVCRPRSTKKCTQYERRDE